MKYCQIIIVAIFGWVVFIFAACSPKTAKATITAVAVVSIVEKAEKNLSEWEGSSFSSENARVSSIVSRLQGFK